MSITKTGLHISNEAKLIYKQRAGLTAGTPKYKSFGDVQTNSVGDWNRNVTNANLFLSNPANDRYTLPTFTGSIPRDGSGNSDPKTKGTLLRDAAWVDYVSDTTVYTATIKSELLAYANNPLFDFSNRTRFSLVNGGLGDANPGFIISEWLLRLLFSYDYIKGSFTSPERGVLDTFFLNAATYFDLVLNKYYSGRYVDRLNGNYTLTSYSTGAERDSPHGKLYYGGPTSGWFVQGYNNRMATIAQFIGITGIFLKSSSLKTSAKRFFYEWLKFGVYPTGEIADLERWAPNDTEKGLDYSMGMISTMGSLVFHFALDGDLSLMNFSTTDGYYGTQSSTPKSFLQTMTNIAGYLNGTHTRYATSTDPSPLSPADKLKIQIDGYDPALSNRNRIVFDTWFSIPNAVYNNATVKANYLRQASGTTPYPTEPLTRYNGANHPWGGNANVYPGALFQFGQMETAVDWLGTAPTPKTNQSITFPVIAPVTFGNSPFSLLATAGSGLAVTFTLISGPGTLAGSTLTITGAGSIVIRASQAGNGTYNAASTVDQTITVRKAIQTITFLNITDKQIGVDTSFSLTATSTSPLPISFEVVSGTGSISGTTFTIAGVGVTTISASQIGDANYLPASFNRSFTVKAAPVIVVTNILLAKTGVSSTEVDDFLITNITDGSVTNSTSQNTHFYIDWNETLLGGSKTVTKVTVTMATPISDFNVQYNPGSGFTNLISITGNTSKIVEVSIPNTIVTNIRWESINKTWKWNLLELSVLGY